MTARIVVDTRPRCKSHGDYLGDPVPCDLHKGHDGKHLWQMPMSFEEFVWTDKHKYVKPL